MLFRSAGADARAAVTLAAAARGRVHGAIPVAVGRRRSRSATCHNGVVGRKLAGRGATGEAAWCILLWLCCVRTERSGVAGALDPAARGRPFIGRERERGSYCRSLMASPAGFRSLVRHCPGRYADRTRTYARVIKPSSIYQTYVTKYRTGDTSITLYSTYIKYICTFRISDFFLQDQSA